MGIFKKIKDAVKEGVQALDEVMPPLPTPKPEPKPKPDSKAEMATPGMDGGCLLRAAEAAGFTGIVIATLTAAIVGRVRR